MDPFVLLLLGMLLVLGGILILRLPAFMALILGAIVVGLLTPETASELAADPIGKRLATAFGTTVGKIGILIAMAAIIGSALAKSGAADRVIRSAMGLFGEKNVSLAFLSSGFLLAIPVFFDTVFYLLFPLARASGFRNPSKYALYLLAVVAGGAMAHSLVPPTPGPIFVASELNVNIGAMIIGGIIVGSFAAWAGYLYASWSSRKWPVPLRDSPEAPLADLDKMAATPTSALPSLAWSMIPILTPLILIAGNTLFSLYYSGLTDNQQMDLQSFSELMAFFGNSNIALTISAGLALILLVKHMPDSKARKKTVQDALSSAGFIILITGAGGAFGQILQQTGIGDRLQEVPMASTIMILPLAFGVTAIMRAAQGSATVSMITAVGILASIDLNSLDFHPLYLALAIGAGSKPFQWMNDSGFWIICKMSGMTESEGLRHVSAMMTVMGFAGLLVVTLGAWLFPLV